MKIIIHLFIVILLVSACDDLILGKDDSIVTLEENLQPPPAMDDGWEVSTLIAENIDPVPIHSLIERFHENPRNVHSMLIFRNNKLVSESYFLGWHRDRLHTTRSAAKSFVSTLTGIAVDQGYFTLDESVYDFFPEYAELSSEQKRKIKIKHLLTMTPGLQWYEDTNRGRVKPSENDQELMEVSDDRLRYFLQKEVVAEPGGKFNYNSGSPFIQAAIINKVVGMTVPEFARKNLLEPLGIDRYYWRVHEDGIIRSAGSIHVRPRDMAKLGQVFLDSGRWHDKQIISSEWVKQATETFIGDELVARGYGYNWWTARHTIDDEEIRMYFAHGNGGQVILVIPSHNAVVVFTGGNFYPLNQADPYGLTVNIILPAMH